MVPKYPLPPNPAICMVRQKCPIVQHYHGADLCIYRVTVIRLTENTLDNQFVITHVKCS